MTDNNYPSDWDSRREAVYERDDHTCQNCGRSTHSHGINLQAHHVVPVKNGGSHSISNLVAMCSDCHNAIHNDSKAPTADSMYNQSDSISNYQNLFKFTNSNFRKFASEAKVHLSAFKQEVGTDQVLNYYQNKGDKIRSDIQNSKKKVASFDPYDNTSSEYVDEDFKDTVSKMKQDLIELYDMFLELDRYLQSYVSHLTTVSCPECEANYDETTDFCGNCGTELHILSMCSDCGQYRSGITQEFCEGCGSELVDYPESQKEAIQNTLSLYESHKRDFDEFTDDVLELISEEITPQWEEQIDNAT